MELESKDLPSNVELEAAILGAILVDNSLIDAVADRVRTDDFFAPIHERIFEAICHQQSTNGVVNAATLFALFKDDEQIKELGGPSYLAKLSATPTGLLMDPRGMAKELAEIGRRRRIVLGLVEATNAALDSRSEIADAIGLADEAIGERAMQSISENDLAECFDQMFAGYDEDDRGVSCGIIPSLDHVLGNLKPGSMNVLAARPGMGKTATALSYGRGAAERGHGVLFVSLEMPGRELVQRVAADMCYDAHQIEYRAIRDGRLDREQRRMVEEAQARARALPLRIASGSALPVGRLASLIRRTKRRMAANDASLDLVIVDYLQLLRTDVRLRSEYEAVSEISCALKAMALDSQVAMMPMAQLSRAVEQRENKRPTLSDLRSSGQIEQDADVVAFLLREQYYLEQSAPPKGNEAYVEYESALAEVRDKIEFIVAKRRNGVQAAATGNFFGKYQAVRG